MLESVLRRVVVTESTIRERILKDAMELQREETTTNSYRVHDPREDTERVNNNVVRRICVHSYRVHDPREDTERKLSGPEMERWFDSYRVHDPREDTESLSILFDGHPQGKVTESTIRERILKAIGLANLADWDRIVTESTIRERILKVRQGQRDMLRAEGLQSPRSERGY